MATPNTHQCVRCGKNRPGRFTRLKDASGRGWSKGGSLPFWYCWTCLEPGQGRDETEETQMPAKATSPITQAITGPGQAVLAKSAKADGLALIGPLTPLVEALVVTTPDEYLAADNLFGRIQAARRTWKDRMERIIRPIRQGLDELYTLSRDVDKPLEYLELKVKEEMASYKREEQRLIREAEEARLAEETRLQAELDERLRKEEAARTKPMKARLAAARQQVEAQVAEVQARPQQEAVRGWNSSSRTTKKVRVIAWGAFIQGIADETIPDNVVEVIQAKLNAYYKANPVGVASWPGVEEYEDTNIVGR